MMKKRVIDYLRTVVKEVIIALIVLGLLAIGSFLPATKPYFFGFLLFIQSYWIKILLIIELILLVYCLIKVKRLSESLRSFSSKLDTLQPSLLSELEKKISALVSDIKMLQKEISTAKTDIISAKDDVYDVKRIICTEKQKITKN